MKTLKEMQAEVREVNEANGWYEGDRTVGDDVALLHSEVSEMFEAYRDGGLADQTAEPVRSWQGADSSTPGSLYCGPGPDARERPSKPEGFGSECADVLIRLLDTCERRGVDLDFEYARKIAHNKTRGHRHGGKLV